MSSSNSVSELVVAATNLAIACEEIDNAVDITAEMKAYFNEELLRTAVGVDQVLNARLFLNAKIEAEKEWRRQSRNREEAYAKVLEQLESQAIELVEAFPNQPFKGTTHPLGVARNPPSVEVSIALKDKSLANVVEMKVIEEHKIPEKYLRADVVFTLDKKAIAADLKAEVEIPWATLKRGKRLTPSAKPKKIEIEEGDA